MSAKQRSDGRSDGGSDGGRDGSGARQQRLVVGIVRPLPLQLLRRLRRAGSEVPIVVAVACARSRVPTDRIGPHSDPSYRSVPQRSAAFRSVSQRIARF